MRSRWLLISLLAMLVVFLGVTGSAAAKPYVLKSSSFTSNGDLISGWQWLRRLDHTATWTFDLAALQAAPVKGGGVYLNFTPLITNGTNGGSGYYTSIPLTLTWTTATGATKVQKLTVSTRNVFKPIDPEDSGGLGYQCYGHATLSSGRWKGATKLVVTATASKTLIKRYHYAVNGDALFIGYSR